MFAFIWSVVKVLFKAFLLLMCLLGMLFVQWEAREFRIK